MKLKAELTKRENQVAELLAWGAAKKEVAEKLGLNTKTDKSKEYKSIVVTSDSNYAGFLSAILMADLGAALLLVKKKHNSDTD